MSLTNEQIDKMEAGREMDGLIAEYVFGWRKMHGPKTDYDGLCESYDVLVPPTIHDPFPLYPPRGSIKPSHFCHNWSTRLIDAWEVREHMKKNGWNFCFVNEVDGFCEVEFWKESALFASHSKEEPIAICRAALKAVINA